MEIKMSANKVDDKPKAVLLFHISQSLFKNKRLKRRLANKTKTKQSSAPKKHSKPKPKPKTKKETVNGHPSPNLAALFSETIEIVSTDDEQQEDEKLPPPNENEMPPQVETSIVLSSDEEDEVTTQARIFPMLTNQTTVQTEVGNAVFELSLTQLRENLQTITKKRKKHRESKRLSKRLKNSNLSGDLSISLLSDDDDRDEEGEGHEKKDNSLDKLHSAMKA